MTPTPTRRPLTLADFAPTTPEVLAATAAYAAGYLTARTTSGPTPLPPGWDDLLLWAWLDGWHAGRAGA